LFQYDRYSLNTLIVERIIKGYGKKTLLNELNFNHMSNDITYAEYSNTLKNNAISDKTLKNSNIYQYQSIFHFRDFICKLFIKNFYILILFKIIIYNVKYMLIIKKK